MQRRVLKKPSNAKFQSRLEMSTSFQGKFKKYACIASVFFADKAIVKLMPYDLSRERIVFRAE